MSGLSLRAQTTSRMPSNLPSNWFYNSKTWKVSWNVKRLSPREASAVIYYRYNPRMKLSIGHIAKLLERSTRTIHRLLSKNSWVHKLFDKRKYHPHTRRMGEWAFQRAYGMLSWFLELWKEGLISNIDLLSGKTAKGEPP